MRRPLLLSVFRLRASIGLQYRTAALTGVAVQLFFGFIFIMVFEAFYAHASADQPMSLSQVVTYQWLKQAFLVLIVLWLRDTELFELITNGNIAYELCRPAGLYGFWFARLAASRLTGALLRCFPVLVISLLLPRPYTLSPPPDSAAGLLFLVALAVGMLLVVAISMLIYISVFITMSPAGSLLLFGVLGEFFAGLIVPVPLMPGWMQTVVYLLPFHWTADFPFRVFTGDLTKTDAAAGIAAQAAWLAALAGIGHAAMKKALRRVVVQGG